MTQPWAFLGVSYQNILKIQRTISPEVLVPRTFPDTFWKAQNEIFALIITAPSSDEIPKKHYYLKVVKKKHTVRVGLPT